MSIVTAVSFTLLIYRDKQSNIYLYIYYFAYIIYKNISFLYLFSFRIWLRLCSVYPSLPVDLPSFSQSLPGHLQPSIP